MNTTILVNIPMTIHIQKTRYGKETHGLKASDREVFFPVNAFLEKLLRPEDTLKCILIMKHSLYSKSIQNLELYKSELEEINQEIGAEIDHVIIDSDFAEERSVHEKLMAQIVEQIKDGSHIIVDMTYGPKDLPIVEFTALHFAEKFLGCQVDNIIYGQGLFNENNEFVAGELCDLSPLYSLHSLTDTMSCNDPDKARKLLKNIIEI